jgi:hypothetical protein
MIKKILKIILVIIIILLVYLLIRGVYHKVKCSDNICQKWEQQKASCQKDCAPNKGKSVFQDENCKVKSIVKIRPGSFPRTSPQGKITFTNELNKQSEVYTMNSDGSNIQCITCDKEALKTTRNRGQSAWSPDGKYIIFTAETIKYPRKGIGTTARPGIGRNHNIWITKADGSAFWQMTDYPDNWGILEPFFSFDGTMVTWGEEFSMEKYPNGKPGADKHPGCWWGWESFIFRKGEELCIWRAKYGKISYDATGNPIITDLKTLNPPNNFTMIETEGFTFDNKGFIYSYVDLDQTPDGRGLWPDIYTTDLNGNNLKQITKTPQAEEEIAYSPDGKKIAIKIMDKYPATNDEIWLMDPDGSNMIQITHFNTKGYPEYDPNSQHNTEQSWDPTGKYIYVGHVSNTKSLGPNLPSDIYKIEFAGPCGKQN